jgi:hypothetical protein
MAGSQLTRACRCLRAGAVCGVCHAGQPGGVALFACAGQGLTWCLWPTCATVAIRPGLRPVALCCCASCCCTRARGQDCMTSQPARVCARAIVRGKASWPSALLRWTVCFAMIAACAGPGRVCCECGAGAARHATLRRLPRHPGVHGMYMHVVALLHIMPLYIMSCYCVVIVPGHEVGDAALRGRHTHVRVRVCACACVCPCVCRTRHPRPAVSGCTSPRMSCSCLSCWGVHVSLSMLAAGRQGAGAGGRQPPQVGSAACVRVALTPAVGGLRPLCVRPPKYGAGTAAWGPATPLHVLACDTRV